MTKQIKEVAPQVVANVVKVDNVVKVLLPVQTRNCDESIIVNPIPEMGNKERWFAKAKDIKSFEVGANGRITISILESKLKARKGCTWEVIK